MEELKACLFCGKPVDRDYAYCPWCGYEFGPGDDVPIARREPAAPVAAPEPASAPVDAGGKSVLLRLTSLEELLSDMERELDLILKTSSADP
jgi:hypothetical protein